MRLIDLYPYRMVDETPEFLLLKRSDKVIYSGEWRMIGGKVKEGEHRADAALRELREETGLIPSLFWAIPSVNSFYDVKNDAVHSIPAFACEIGYGSEIKLNHEHTDYGWFTAEKATEIISWPEQQRLILLVNSILKTGNINPVLIIKS